MSTHGSNADSKTSLAREEVEQEYERAASLAVNGNLAESRRVYAQLRATLGEGPLAALVRNDLAVLSACDGNLASAEVLFSTALAIDGNCQVAARNLEVLRTLPVAISTPQSVADNIDAGNPHFSESNLKVAVVSFLFNWPSSGGGIVHTVELARFLGTAGYQVKHFYVRYAPWEIGVVTQALPIDSEAIDFDESSWTASTIQARMRDAVRAFDPDYVIISDSWNFKPLLAQALQEFPYLLRLQALECLCPLNNVRLLIGPQGQPQQCLKYQLATPRDCIECVQLRRDQSGSLHEAERSLSGVGTPAYERALFAAFARAEAVLVVNPLAEAMVGPFARAVRVVPSGFDPGRFPWPPGGTRASGSETILLFAGLTDELMKGYRVLQAACDILWARRQDFRLVVTADPPDEVDPFGRYIGWQSQEDLPGQIREADILVMPTVAQEALGRTVVEAMGCGRPVVASRIGGLQFTVCDGATGLLCEPNDPTDLAAKLAMLLDDPQLRERMGEAARQRFDEVYRWDVIIERHYRPLLRHRRRRQ